MLTRETLLRVFWTVLFVGINVVCEVKLKDVTIAIQLPERCEARIDQLKPHQLRSLKEKVAEVIRDEVMNIGLSEAGLATEE